MELEDFEPKSTHSKTEPVLTGLSGRTVGSSTREDGNTSDLNETLPSPTTAQAEQVQTWKSPRINIYRVSASFWSFAIMGMNDVRYPKRMPHISVELTLRQRA